MPLKHFFLQFSNKSGKRQPRFMFTYSLYLFLFPKRSSCCRLWVAVSICGSQVASLSTFTRRAGGTEGCETTCPKPETLRGRNQTAPCPSLVWTANDSRNCLRKSANPPSQLPRLSVRKLFTKNTDLMVKTVFQEQHCHNTVPVQPVIFFLGLDPRPTKVSQDLPLTL